MKIINFNINGIRAINRKQALSKVIDGTNPDIICLQEVRADPQTAFREFSVVTHGMYPYQYCNSSLVRKGYAGTAIMSKIKPQADITTEFSDLHVAKDEGRITALEFDTFVLVCVYTPNSGQQLDRLAYRTEVWEPVFNNCIQRLQKKYNHKSLIIAGDLNVAHNEIDLHSPLTNLKNAGFTIEERNMFSSLLDSTKLVDVFRHLYPNVVKYTYWSNFHQSRAKNKGWRIDYYLVQSKFLKQIIQCEILDSYYGSDHAPILLELKA